MNKMNREKKLSLIFSIALISGAILLCLPFVQNILLIAIGKITGKPLNQPEIWINRMIKISFAACSLVLVFWLHIYETCTESKIVNRLKLFLELLLISLLTSSLFYAFPLNSQFTSTDSSVFIYIGQGMHNALVPYRDMFDHKGLYLYFLEFLGTYFDGYIGIYLIELISIFITITFLHKAAGLATENNFVKFLATFSIICLVGRKFFEGGNLTEEYALPCIAFSNYVFLKYLVSGKITFKETVIVGMSFVFVLFLRANMVAPWVFYVLYLFIASIKNRKFEDLRKMTAGFIAGLVAASVPVVIYTLLTHSFSDMWNSYILFNFKYISDQGGLKSNLSVAIKFAKIFAVPLFCFIIELLQKKDFKTSLINFLAFVFTFFFVVISGRGYRHYGMILLPFFVFPVTYVLDVLRRNILMHSQKPKVILIKAFALLTVLIPIWKMPLAAKPYANEIIDFLKNQTPYDSNILVLGNDVKYYLKSGKTSNQKFFYQKPVLKQNPEFMKEFLHDVEENLPDYIILPGRQISMTSDSDFSALFNLIDKYYSVKTFEEGKVFTLTY